MTVHPMIDEKKQSPHSIVQGCLPHSIVQGCLKMSEKTAVALLSASAVVAAAAAAAAVVVVVVVVVVVAVVAVVAVVVVVDIVGAAVVSGSLIAKKPVFHQLKAAQSPLPLPALALTKHWHSGSLSMRSYCHAVKGQNHRRSQGRSDSRYYQIHESDSYHCRAPAMV